MPSVSIHGAIARWAEASCALGGAVAAMLALDGRFLPWARGVREVTGASVHLDAYIGFTLVVAAAICGTLGGLALRWLGRRSRRPRVAPACVLAAVALLGWNHAPWLLWAAPLIAVIGAPLLVADRVRSPPWRDRQRTWALVCVACEASCVGVGLWLPYSDSLPAMLLPLMFGVATVAAYVAAFHLGDDSRWRVVFAGIPCILLPFAGLNRNPTLVPTVAAGTLGAVMLGIMVRWPRRAQQAQTWAQRHAASLAMPSLLFILVIPWHFRDLGVADLGGHEGQHLGWINSISFGKLMMADAGFTYGPLREYMLALLAWTMGGLTLDHIRIAHVVVNVAGLLFTFAAMRRVCAGQIHALLLGLALIVTHSALASFVVYTKTYSFGWADASRAGLASLAVVVALTRPLDGSRGARRRLIGAGALTGLAILYSHDFGVPAALSTWLGLALETLVARSNAPLGARARAALRYASVYAVGLALILLPFILVYASRGRLLALLRGYAWTVQVSSGRVAFVGRDWAYGDAFNSLHDLRRHVDKDDTYVVSNAVDFVIGPGLAILGLAHVATALALRRVAQRTTVILGLSVLTAAVMHHALLNADAWHMQNATTPGLVLLVALGAGGTRLTLRLPNRRLLPLGVMAAASISALWFANGGCAPINIRLARIASGEERPAKGDAYAYPDLPRAGDVGIGHEHLDPVRWIVEHTKPEDPVLCTTWMLGGGTEAFLAHRRNPTSFDKPDEVAGEIQRRRLLRELEREPPVLIVGNFFDYMDDETRKLIEKGWHVETNRPVDIRRRNE